MMKRRQFIALLGGAMAWPLTARAQQRALPVIGFLRAGQPPKSWVTAFQQGLRERGYVDGQNIVVEFRFTDGRIGQLPPLAEELVRLKVDVILASAPPAALAAKKATTSVPIVFILNNPVEIGLVPSLGRPGGNITGLAHILLKSPRSAWSCSWSSFPSLGESQCSWINEIRPPKPTSAAWAGRGRCTDARHAA